MKSYYVVVSNDYLELPYFVGETMKEIGDWLGITTAHVNRTVKSGCISHSCKFPKRYKIVRVPQENDNTRQNRRDREGKEMKKEEYRQRISDLEESIAETMDIIGDISEEIRMLESEIRWKQYKQKALRSSLEKMLEDESGNEMYFEIQQTCEWINDYYNEEIDLMNELNNCRCRMISFQRDIEVQTREIKKIDTFIMADYGIDESQVS